MNTQCVWRRKNQAGVNSPSPCAAVAALFALRTPRRRDRRVGWISGRRPDRLLRLLALQQLDVTRGRLLHHIGAAAHHLTPGKGAIDPLERPWPQAIGDP